MKVFFRNLSEYGIPIMCAILVLLSIYGIFLSVSNRNFHSMKRIIQISTIPAVYTIDGIRQNSRIFALTSDGKLYTRSSENEYWDEIEGIPGDEPDNQKVIVCTCPKNDSGRIRQHSDECEVHKYLVVNGYLPPDHSRTQESIDDCPF